MVRILRPTRIAAAAALVVSTFAVFGASPAGAASGSLASASNGVTVTYSGTTQNDHVDLLAFGSGHTCSINDPAMQATYYMTSDPTSPQAMQLAASPVTLTFGSSAFTLQGFTATTIAAGSYTFCLKTNVFGPGGQAIAAQLDVTIVDPNATTTTSSTTSTSTTSTSTTTTVASGSPSTTAAAGSSANSGANGSVDGDPMVPAFTG